MNYVCEVKIHSNINHVFDLFLQHMVKNETYLPGRKTSFTYSYGEMTETIESIDRPKSIVTIYEVKNVWNRCVNHFTDEGEFTRWMMESEFKFSEAIQANQETFINQTQKTMYDFKKLVEVSAN